ncbi:type III secretion system protein SctP [Paraburkholderia sp.]|uniref:type III secretion system protein SctP n=1 Tax=Paraburkholderia sp. TaxID=1926495 RepID=UPI003D6FD5B8
MHTSGTHRAHVIAGPAPDQPPAHADTPQLRRQAALFNAHRAALEEAEAEAEAAVSAQEPKPDGDAAGSQQEAQQHPAMRSPMPGVSAGTPSPFACGNADADAAAAMLSPRVGEQESGQRHGQQPQDDANRDEGSRARTPTPVAATLTMRTPPSASTQPGPQSGAFAAAPSRAGAGMMARAGSLGSPGANTSDMSGDRSGGQGQPSSSQPRAPVFAMLHQQTAQPQMQPQPQAQTQPQPQLQPQAQPAYARVEAASNAQAIGALDNKQQPNPLIDSIVSSVADFCANPVVFSCSPWHITVPLDPALLPGCQLSLMLSHFDLTLRFSTTDTASQQLILRHADALKDQLETLPGLHRDNRRRIDITVT